MLKHIDLFSGIGGFSLALDTIFYDHEIEHIFCDNNPFSQAVIRKHWPTAEIYGDIRTLTNSKSWKDNGRGRGELAQTTTGGESSDTSSGTGNQSFTHTTNSGVEKMRERTNEVFLVTGGFPCQPFSAAGRRKGTADDRYLWPEMFRVIREFKPSWVVAENVRGLVTWNDGLVLEQVCVDLESEDYEVQPLIIPACAVNAPQRRDRIWFIAHRANNGGRGRDSEKRRNGTERELVEEKQKRDEARRESERRFSWSQNWLEVATELCSVDDGLPGRMGDTTISRAKHRNEQLKAYGNAIVPQVAMEIFKAIKAVNY